MKTETMTFDHYAHLNTALAYGDTDALDADDEDTYMGIVEHLNREAGERGFVSWDVTEMTEGTFGYPDEKFGDCLAGDVATYTVVFFGEAPETEDGESELAVAVRELSHHVRALNLSTNFAEAEVREVMGKCAAVLDVLAERDEAEAPEQGFPKALRMEVARKRDRELRFWGLRARAVGYGLQLQRAEWEDAVAWAKDVVGMEKKMRDMEAVGGTVENSSRPSGRWEPRTGSCGTRRSSTTTLRRHST